MRRMIPILGLALVLRMDGVQVDRVLMSVSYYTSLDGVYPTDITASGAPVGPGVAACGPSYDFGLTILLDCGILVTCQDRGIEIGDGNLDIWLPVDADGTDTTAHRMGRHNEWAWVIQ